MNRLCIILIEGRMGLKKTKHVLWMALVLAMLYSCVENSNSSLSHSQQNNLKIYIAVRDYLLVNGRPPKDKKDFVKFLESKTNESTFYNEVLNLTFSKTLEFNDLDTSCTFSINDTIYTTNFKRKDGIYCNGNVCDSLEYIREQLTQLKNSFIKSQANQLAVKNYYFKTPIWINKTQDLIFKRIDDDFLLIRTQDIFLNELYENFGSTIPNHLLEFGVDSLVLMMYSPYYSEFEPPPPPI